MKGNYGWIAGGLILAGMAICAASAVAAGFDWGKLSTAPLVTKTYPLNDDFSVLRIEDYESSVRLFLAEDGESRVVCRESDNGRYRYDLSVSGGELSIRRVDQRRWYERVGLFLGVTHLEVYLAQTDYDRLAVTTASGCIRIPEAFHFVEAQGKSASGCIEFSAAVEESLTLETASGTIEVDGSDPTNLTVKSRSGRIFLRNVSAKDEVTGENASGGLSLEKVSCETLRVRTSSGGISLADVVTTGSLMARSESGRIRLDRCDGEGLSLRSASGSITGTLRTDKVFFPESASGSIRVPHTAAGGTCEVTTQSGNIDLAIE